MKKKEIITITGSLGSGKSSTSDLVAKNLGFKRFSGGDFFRKIGLDLGISLNEVSKRAENDPQIDEMTDNELRKLRDSEKIVIDSRLAFYWIPESFKVYLNLSPEIAKERILKSLEENALRKQSESSSTVEQIYEKIVSRLESEKKRYLKLYNLEHTDPKNFDLVIDTEKNDLNQVVEIVLKEYKKWIGDN